MQKPTKNKLSYIIIFLLPLISVLYYRERKQSYEPKFILQPLTEPEKTTQANYEKIYNNNDNKQRIIITNGITKEMLTYKHWSGSYEPTTFVITISGNPISYNETAQVEIENQESILIRYDYSFVNGYKKGSREIEFTISPEKNDYILSFSWKEPAHLILENASIKKATVIPFNKSLESKKT